MQIERFAADILDEQEWHLAERLSFLLGDNRYNVTKLILEIIPTYWEKVEDRLRTLAPDNIYRPLYYIHTKSGNKDFENNTRSYMGTISAHLEGCLMFLTSSPPSREYGVSPQPFGRLVGPLMNSNIISPELAAQLWKFNELVNIPSKHYGAYAPTRWLDERTFSIFETACAFVLMRKLSIQLFKILETKGVPLPHGWPDFKHEWLSYSKVVESPPIENNDSFL
jgi:hypothetical protein